MGETHESTSAGTTTSLWVPSWRSLRDLPRSTIWERFMNRFSRVFSRIFFWDSFLDFSGSSFRDCSRILIQKFSRCFIYEICRKSPLNSSRKYFRHFPNTFLSESRGFLWNSSRQNSSKSSQTTHPRISQIPADYILKYFQQIFLMEVLEDYIAKFRREFLMDLWNYFRSSIWN